jgi:hypothetical protein
MTYKVISAQQARDNSETSNHGTEAILKDI